MFARIYDLTNLSIARGVGFASLAVLCFMVGFAGDTVNMLRVGGFGALLMATTLYLKAINTRPGAFKRTEVWIMLSEAERPPGDIAGALIAHARREVMLTWALRAATGACFMLGAATLLLLIR